jgi:hypothetical protein
VGVAAVGGGAVLDEVAGEADALLGQPGRDVAGGVAAAEVEEVDAASA